MQQSTARSNADYRLQQAAVNEVYSAEYSIWIDELWCRAEFEQYDCLRKLLCIKR